MKHILLLPILMIADIVKTSHLKNHLMNNLAEEPELTRAIEFEQFWKSHINDNEKPVIGIIAQNGSVAEYGPDFEQYTSYLMAAYIRFA